MNDKPVSKTRGGPLESPQAKSTGGNPGLRRSLKTPEHSIVANLVNGAIETVCKAASIPHFPASVGLRVFIFRRADKKLVCTHYYAERDPAEPVGLTIPMTKERADWAIVRAIKEGPNFAFQKVDAKRQQRSAKETGVSPSIKSVLAARIHNPDRSIWGVVDFDAFSQGGCDRLATEAAQVAICDLARHLGLLFSIEDQGAGPTQPERPQKAGRPKCFIVHGRNDSMKGELKNYLQNTLDLGEPVILHEQPAMGRTIIEKFEQEAQNVDLVFVLLTPDDLVASGDEENSIKRRARQNVIFEMGYFFAKLQRLTGRVFLLSQGGVELPSDISGIIYVDISRGIKAAGEELRQELRPWLKC